MSGNRASVSLFDDATEGEDSVLNDPLSEYGTTVNTLSGAAGLPAIATLGAAPVRSTAATVFSSPKGRANTALTGGRGVARNAIASAAARIFGG